MNKVNIEQAKAAALASFEKLAKPATNPVDDVLTHVIEPLRAALKDGHSLKTIAETLSAATGIKISFNRLRSFVDANKLRRVTKRGKSKSDAGPA